jgi:Domain of unknown function (DUF5658)
MYWHLLCNEYHESNEKFCALTANCSRMKHSWQYVAYHKEDHLIMVIRISPRTSMLLALFAALNIGDLVSTWIDLQAGLREGNPFMNFLLQEHGFGALIAYKILVILLVGVVTALMWQVRPRLVGYTLIACDFLVFCAITINVLQFPS